MKSWVRHSLRAGVLAAGFLLFATSPAQAGDQVSAFNSGIASGNNVSVPIAVAANVCGNGVGVLGAGVGVSGVCVADASNEETTESQTSVGNSGIVSGNNVSVPIAVAANVCGNGVGVAGVGVGFSGVCVAKASNDGDDNGKKKHYKKSAEGSWNGKDGKDGKDNGGNGQFSAFNSGILSGNNISVPIAVAANVCGNGVGVLGAGLGISGVCVAKASNEENAGEDGQTSIGNSGILSGNNVHIPIAVALNVCGNGVGVAGLGVGISGACIADASNNGDDNGRKKGHKKHDNNGMKHNNNGDYDDEGSKEVLPSLQTPLPGAAGDLSQPLNAATAPVLGGSSGINKPDVQLPTDGNTVGLPGLV